MVLDAALDILRQARHEITLLITDIVMPHMDGFDLVSQVARSSPETKVLFISGYAEQSIAVRGGLKEGGHAFLLKPFTPDELTLTIDRVLKGTWKPDRGSEDPVGGGSGRCSASLSASVAAGPSAASRR